MISASVGCGDDEGSSNNGTDDVGMHDTGSMADAGMDGNDMNDGGMDDAGSDASEMAMGTATAAAELRATLTNLLQEHVYLAGIALRTAVEAGGDLQDPQVVAATDALDENTVALADAIGSLYGDQARTDFLDMWRTHIGFFVDYTIGKATSDQDMVDQALSDLEGYRNDFASFLNTATEGRLPEAAVKQNLETHVDTVTAAIDALVAGDTAAYTKLRVAAQHMPGVAMGLSAGFDDQFDLEGSTAGPGATLRAQLTSLLQEHVYLAGVALTVAVEAGGDLQDPQVVAATEALDENTVALADAIGSLYGDQARTDFLDMWRTHIGFFVDYTIGKATSDQDMVDQALSDLEGYRNDFASFLNTATEGRLPEAAVKQNLETHVDTVTAAIDALVAGDTAAYTKLRVAAQHMPGVAAALSAAFYDQFGDQM